MTKRRTKQGAAHIAKVCEMIGISLSGERQETPERAFKALRDMMKNASVVDTNDPKDLPFKMKTFSCDPNMSMVVLKDIDFISTCEHHLLPFLGTVCVGYLPGTKLIGLSKVNRLVEFLSKAPQMQETFTARVAEYLEHHLEPVGIAVLTRAVHTCVCGRGVRAFGSKTICYAVRGQNGVQIKDEVLALTK